MLRTPAAIVLLLLLAPSAGAFATESGDVYIAYDARAPPGVLATGAIALDGIATSGLLVGGSYATRAEAVPVIRIVDRAGGGSTFEIAGGTLQIDSGALLLAGDDENAPVALDAEAPYGIGLALPRAPLPGSPGGEPPAGFLLAGERIDGTARWAGGAGSIVLLDAVVTLRDASGTPIPGWDGREVNQGAAASDDPDSLRTLVMTEGAYTLRVGATVVGGATGGPAAVEMRVARAAEDRLEPTLDLLAETGRGLLGTQPDQLEQLRILVQVSGILNGAVLVASPETAAGVPIESRFGSDEFAPGKLSVLRGETLSLAWEQGEMRVAGEPTLVLGRDGFETDPPATLGLFPIVSLVLWAGAIGALVAYFVKRPPEGRPQVSLRLLSIALWALALFGVFFLWDKSFEATFGEGVFSTIADQGITSASLPKIGVLLLIEMVPWGIAGLLFALPVRIALGVGLRYLGRGKSFKGVATAGGLVALAIFGPTYALWCFNLVWTRAAGSLGG